MKRLLLVMSMLMLVSLVSASAFADYLGMRASTSFVSVPLNFPTDSAGNNRPVVPDSAHVMTWKDSTAGQVIYSAATTILANFGTTCKIHRDTLNGMIYWVLSDSVATLNVGTTQRFISGAVTLWWKGAPFVTRFSMDVGLWATPLDVWQILMATAFDPGSAGEYLRAAVLKADTIMWLNGQKPGAKSKLRAYSNRDTLDVYINGVLYSRQIYDHPGGYPGRWPDSTNTVGP